MAGTWADWRVDAAAPSWTVGLEEEVMLVEPFGWALAHSIDSVLPALAPQLRAQVSPETHGAAVELTTRPHASVAPAVAELAELRCGLAAGLEPLGLRAAVAGTHPFASWQETQISGGDRQALVYGSMRELARREPTFALHVHVGVPDPERAVRVANRLRGHLPLLLALSANSPFWQGRDTGLASARTPLFQAFPRVGIPRAFRGYDDYAETIDLLLRCEAFPESTFLWWDVRLQPRFGTVEVRIMDAQTSLADTAALAALVQALARLEAEDRGFVSERLIEAPEVLEENRFLGARDGIEGHLIDPDAERRIPAREWLERTLAAVEPHAADLGCRPALDGVQALARQPGSRRQLDLARGPGRLRELVASLSEAFLAEAQYPPLGACAPAATG